MTVYGGSWLGCRDCQPWERVAVLGPSRHSGGPIVIFSTVCMYLQLTVAVLAQARVENEALEHHAEVAKLKADLCASGPDSLCTATCSPSKNRRGASVCYQ